jgi:hypothetical protein
VIGEVRHSVNDGEEYVVQHLPQVSSLHHQLVKLLTAPSPVSTSCTAGR